MEKKKLSPYLGTFLRFAPYFCFTFFAHVLILDTSPLDFVFGLCSRSVVVPPLIPGRHEALAATLRTWPLCEQHSIIALTFYETVCSVVLDEYSWTLLELAFNTDSLGQRARMRPHFSAIVGFLPGHNWTFPCCNVLVDLLNELTRYGCF